MYYAAVQQLQYQLENERRKRIEIEKDLLKIKMRLEAQKENKEMNDSFPRVALDKQERNPKHISEKSTFWSINFLQQSSPLTPSPTKYYTLVKSNASN